MDSLTNLVPADALKDIAQADVTSWSMKCTLVWFLMSSKVKTLREDFKDHVGVIEKGFSDLTSEMKDLKTNVTADLAKHSDILDNVRSEVKDLSTRVIKLENKKE